MKVLKGVVSTGIGDFSKKMEDIPGLLEAYQRKTGMSFYPGTLNVRLQEEYSIPKDALKLDKEEYGGRVSVFIVPCMFFDKEAFILRTEKNESGAGDHPKTIVEIASDVKLRDAYNLKDGDEIEITIS